MINHNYYIIQQYNFQASTFVFIFYKPYYFNYECNFFSLYFGLYHCKKFPMSLGEVSQENIEFMFDTTISKNPKTTIATFHLNKINVQKLIQMSTDDMFNHYIYRDFNYNNILHFNYAPSEIDFVCKIYKKYLTNYVNCDTIFKSLKQRIGL